MKTIKLYIFSFLTVTLLVPSFAYAQTSGIMGLLTDFQRILGYVVPVVIGLGLVFFFWGMITFIMNSANEKMRQQGKQRMIWGVIALFVMFSITGILFAIGDLIGLPVNTSPQLEYQGIQLPNTPPQG